MSQQKTEDTVSVPLENPLKRKRGRPRKEGTSVQQDNIFKIPATQRKKNIQDSITDTHSDNVEMVGQSVSAIIDGKFESGYLLTVHLPNIDTPMRGVVFKPGHVVPITKENDIAPHVKMYERKEIPFPGLSVQTQIDTAVQHCKQDDKVTSELEKQELTAEEQSDLIAKMEQDALLQALDIVDGKVSVPESSSGPQASLDQHQPKSYISDLSEFKSPTQDHDVASCSSNPPKIISMQNDSQPVSYSSLKNSTEENMDPNPVLKASSGDDTTQMNEMTVDEAVDSNYSSFPSEIKNIPLPNEMTIGNAVDGDDSSFPSEAKNIPSAMNNQGEVLPNEMTVGDAVEVKNSPLVMNVEGEVLPNELKPPTDESEHSDIVPQISDLDDSAKDMDCDNEDAITTNTQT